MKYARSEIDVIGPIWMPPTVAATTYPVTAHDVASMTGDDGTVTRESVALWLDSHSGDFRAVTDFHASIEVGPDTVDIPWQSEDSAEVFADCIWPDDDESGEWIDPE